MSEALNEKYSVVLVKCGFTGESYILCFCTPVKPLSKSRNLHCGEPGKVDLQCSRHSPRKHMVGAWLNLHLTCLPSAWVLRWSRDYLIDAGTIYRKKGCRAASQLHQKRKPESLLDCWRTLMPHWSRARKAWVFQRSGGSRNGSASTGRAAKGYKRILPLYSPRPCFVLPASTYQSALLSSPTVSDRFLPRGPQHGFNATCDERRTRYMRLERPWVRFASPFARRVKPYLSGEMRTRLQDSWHRTYKMDI